MEFRNFTICVFFLFLFFSPFVSFSQIPTNGLVGYYMMDGDAADSGPLANDGVMMGNIIPTTNRFGEAGKAQLLNGGWIDLGNLPELQFTDSVSVAAWINTTEIDRWAGILAKWDNGTNSGLFLGVNPSGNVVRWNLSNMPDPVEGSEIFIGEWVHLVATYDGEKATLYYDGELVDVIDHSTPIPQNNSGFTIGSQTAGTATYSGAMDDVLLYNRALTQEEVTIIFNGVTSSTQDNVYDTAVDISPNPTNGILKIDNKSKRKIVSYMLSDVTGQVLQTGDYQNELDFGQQPSGVYYISFKFEDGSATKKLIKH